MSNQSRAQSFPVQLVDLILIELSNWRWSWRSIVVVSTCVPLFGMVGLSIYARDLGPEVAVRGIQRQFGDVADARQPGQHSVACRIHALSRNARVFRQPYPSTKHALMLAIIIAFFLLSLPALLTLLIIGSALLRISLAPHPLLLLVIPLCVLPMSAIGALIGVRAGSPQQGSSLSVLTAFVFAGLGPVLFPAERLPEILRLIGTINPAARAASALRQSLIGPLGEQIALDLAILLGFTLLRHLFGRA